ncbi:MAG TPA: hypothetical protein VIX81_04165 [Gammaproteobacteria bacterium]
MSDEDAHKLITCIVPKEAALPALKGLRDEWQIVSANITYARGAGHLAPLSYRGMGEQSEKEILTVVVDAGRADEVFGYLYEAARIGRPHGGIMYMHGLLGATRYTLPEVPEEG